MAPTAESWGGLLFCQGDRVEIFGLTSDAGKSLNGSRGVLGQMHKDTGRFDVQIGDARAVAVKPDHLMLIEKAAKASANKALGALGPDDIVEVFGLDGAMGKSLNGRKGKVVQDENTCEEDRVTLQFCDDAGGSFTLHVRNLRRVEKSDAKKPATAAAKDLADDSNLLE
eukprot:gnl/TRDRNA2_/TRDRNA2_182447_c0_seq1.p1 gnl/TRDRNA2_/TRDRNA2_182447_c0~~gnl/TRDRNA2_/TRDRNA2_182447_c0_seq1.p1  ORF type:complete len:169 (+),score=52.15 gnl/TRDRNA2_/TRDRNA2_182447_c0_seq1:61-567(+)